LPEKARRLGKGSPGFVGGLLAALALRTGAKVATQNVKNLTAMGCLWENSLKKSARRAAD
jgi:predicted nucleic acid-binding protein